MNAWQDSLPAINYSSVRLPHSPGERADILSLWACTSDLAQVRLLSAMERSLYSQGGLQYSLKEIFYLRTYFLAVGHS